MVLSYEKYTFFVFGYSVLRLLIIIKKNCGLNLVLKPKTDVRTRIGTVTGTHLTGPTSGPIFCSFRFLGIRFLIRISTDQNLCSSLDTTSNVKWTCGFNMLFIATWYNLYNKINLLLKKVNINIITYMNTKF